MNLEAIKKYMINAATCRSDEPEYDAGFSRAVQLYNSLLDKLDPSEPLRRVREKVQIKCDSFQNDTVYRNSFTLVLKLIDAELKEQKEMKKQKITCEIEVEHDQELKFVCAEVHQLEDAIGGMQSATVLMSLRPIAPPLELESDLLERNGKVESAFIQEYEGGLSIVTDFAMRPVELRDFIKIASHYLENGKLPDRVVVKEATPQGGK